jgi:hypothetical protein
MISVGSEVDGASYLVGNLDWMAVAGLFSFINVFYLLDHCIF